MPSKVSSGCGKGGQAPSSVQNPNSNAADVVRSPVAYAGHMPAAMPDLQACIDGGGTLDRLEHQPDSRMDQQRHDVANTSAMLQQSDEPPSKVITGRPINSWQRQADPVSPSHQQPWTVHYSQMPLDSIYQQTSPADRTDDTCTHQLQPLLEEQWAEGGEGCSYDDSPSHVAQDPWQLPHAYQQPSPSSKEAADRQEHVLEETPSRSAIAVFTGDSNRRQQHEMREHSDAITPQSPNSTATNSSTYEAVIHKLPGDAARGTAVYGAASQQWDVHHSPSDMQAGAAVCNGKPFIMLGKCPVVNARHDAVSAARPQPRPLSPVASLVAQQQTAQHFSHSNTGSMSPVVQEPSQQPPDGHMCVDELVAALGIAREAHQSAEHEQSSARHVTAAEQPTAPISQSAPVTGNPTPLSGSRRNSKDILNGSMAATKQLRRLSTPGRPEAVSAMSAAQQSSNISALLALLNPASSTSKACSILDGSNDAKQTYTPGKTNEAKGYLASVAGYAQSHSSNVQLQFVSSSDADYAQNSNDVSHLTATQAQAPAQAQGTVVAGLHPNHPGTLSSTAVWQGNPAPIDIDVFAAASNQTTEGNAGSEVGTAEHTTPNNTSVAPRGAQLPQPTASASSTQGAFNTQQNLSPQHSTPVSVAHLIAALQEATTSSRLISTERNGAVLGQPGSNDTGYEVRPSLQHVQSLGHRTAHEQQQHQVYEDGETPAMSVEQLIDSLRRVTRDSRYTTCDSLPGSPTPTSPTAAQHQMQSNQHPWSDTDQQQPSSTQTPHSMSLQQLMSELQQANAGFQPPADQAEGFVTGKWSDGKGSQPASSTTVDVVDLMADLHRATNSNTTTGTGDVGSAGYHSARLRAYSSVVQPSASESLQQQPSTPMDVDQLISALRRATASRRSTADDPEQSSVLPASAAAVAALEARNSQQPDDGLDVGELIHALKDIPENGSRAGDTTIADSYFDAAETDADSDALAASEDMSIDELLHALRRVTNSRQGSGGGYAQMSLQPSQSIATPDYVASDVDGTVTQDTTGTAADWSVDGLLRALRRATESRRNSAEEQLPNPEEAGQPQSMHEGAKTNQSPLPQPAGPTSTEQHAPGGISSVNNDNAAAITALPVTSVGAPVLPAAKAPAGSNASTLPPSPAVKYAQTAGNTDGGPVEASTVAPAGSTIAQQPVAPTPPLAPLLVNLSDKQCLSSEQAMPNDSAGMAPQAMSGVVAILDPNLGSQQRCQLQEALKSVGGRVASGTHLGCGANMVVCDPDHAVQWLPMMLDIVSPVWLLKACAVKTNSSAGEGSVNRGVRNKGDVATVRLSADVCRMLAHAVSAHADADSSSDMVKAASGGSGKGACVNPSAVGQINKAPGAAETLDHRGLSSTPVINTSSVWLGLTGGEGLLHDMSAATGPHGSSTAITSHQAVMPGVTLTHLSWSVVQDPRYVMLPKLLLLVRCHYISIVTPFHHCKADSICALTYTKILANQGSC